MTLVKTSPLVLDYVDKKIELEALADIFNPPYISSMKIQEIIDLGFQVKIMQLRIDDFQDNDGIEHNLPSKLISVLSTIKKETIPMPNHDDPGAIQDCWTWLEEGLEYYKNLFETESNQGS